MLNMFMLYNTYNVQDSTIPEREEPQRFNVSGCLCRHSHPKQPVPTQKQIGYSDEDLCRQPWMVASAGETDRDLAWTQLAQKLGVYNII
jgi:hypothetical protein